MSNSQPPARQFRSLFSSGIGPDSGTLQLMDDLGVAAARDEPVCMLGGGNPALIPEIEQVMRDQMHEMLESDRRFETMIGQYSSPQGDTQFIRAIAGYLHAEFGWDLTADNIAITNGSQSGFAWLFNVLAGRDQGQQERKICLPMTPEYIGYGEVDFDGDSLFHSIQPLIDKDASGSSFKYRVDFDALELDENRFSAVCLSRPTNPTGNVVTDQELTRLNELSIAAGLPLIIDGAYGLPFPNIVFRQATPIWNPNIILCLSLSKLGLPGVRTGIVVADSALIRKITGANAIYSLAPGSFGPALTTTLFTENRIKQLCHKIIQPHYQSRSRAVLKYLDDVMQDIPLRVHRSEGAIFLWLWFEDLPITSAELYERLKARGVFVIPGHNFFPGLAGDWSHRHECIRVSYAAEWSEVTRGIDVIHEEISGLYS